MRMRILAPALLAGALALTNAAQAAQLKVMGDSPLGPALKKLADVYRHDAQTEIALVLGPSPEVEKKIEEGEVADLVIVQPDFVEELAKSGKVSATGERPMIGRVGIGLAVRSDRPTPDITTPEKLKAFLLTVDTLSFNQVKSGNYFATVLERLGIADQLQPKILRTAPLATFDPVRNGKGNDVAAATLPLIATTPGIKELGPLPGDLQDYLTYTAVPLAGTQQREAALRFIKFLTSANAKKILAANGVD